jgi:hypothetical protein
LEKAHWRDAKRHPNLQSIDGYAAKLLNAP